MKKSDLSLSLFRIQFFVRQHKNTLSFFLAPPADLVIPGYLCVTYVNPPNTHQILDAKPKPARLPQLYLFASELHSATAQPLILESPAFEQVLKKISSSRFPHRTFTLFLLLVLLPNKFAHCKATLSAPSRRRENLNLLHRGAGK